MLKTLFFWFAFLTTGYRVIAQTEDTAQSGWRVHYQMTAIMQYHPAFHAAYSGKNSLSSYADHALSLTATLYVGRALWRNAFVYFSPELSGGKGFDNVHGIAGFTNGDIYRVDDPTPQFYIARLYGVQYFPLGFSSTYQDDAPLQMGGYIPDRRLEIIAGKLSMTDLFDDNPISHDPRTQFLNWSIMDDGAWDFPADTRGYDAIVAVGYVSPRWTLRMAESLEPTRANGNKLNWNLHRSHAETVECIYASSWHQHHFYASMHVYRNFTPAPLYEKVVREKLSGIDTSLDVIDPAPVSHSKYGLGISMSYEINDQISCFARSGWNDGHTATWAFTEIDRSLCLGVSYQTPVWHKQQRMQIGLACVVNGLSAPHRHFLQAGGYGFVIGDGELHYRTEDIGEIYLSFPLHDWITITADMQWISHSAYNRDRGPVAVGSMRMHVAF
jgi:high affinity Mn2+ porin